jgi:hypothetical protein
MLGILLIGAALFVGYLKLYSPTIVSPAGDATIAPAPSRETVAIGQSLVGIGAGVAAGGGGGAALAGLEIGSALAGSGASTVEAGALGALTGGLIAGGPLGALLGAGLAVYSAQEVLMGEVRAFRDIQFMLTIAEDSKWQGMKKKATTWPTSADAWRHKSLHSFEVDMTDKYTSLEGRAAFETRVVQWVDRQPTLTSKGEAWVVALGITRREPTTMEAAFERVNALIGAAS